MPFCGGRQTFSVFLQRRILNLKEVAGEHLPTVTAQVHRATLAVTPDLALGTFIGFHPFAVTIRLEAILPYIPEIILVYIALMVVTANAKASRDGAVAENGCNACTCNATE